MTTLIADLLHELGIHGPKAARIVMHHQAALATVREEAARQPPHVQGEGPTVEEIAERLSVADGYADDWWDRQVDRANDFNDGELSGAAVRFKMLATEVVALLAERAAPPAPARLSPEEVREACAAELHRLELHHRGKAKNAADMGEPSKNYRRDLTIAAAYEVAATLIRALPLTRPASAEEGR